MNTVELKSVLLNTTILEEDIARLLAEFAVPTIRSTIDEILDAAEDSPPQANEWGGAKLTTRLGVCTFAFQYVQGTLTEILACGGQHRILIEDPVYVTGNGRTDVLRKLEQEMDLNVEFTSGYGLLVRTV